MGIYRRDANGGLVSANPRLAEIFGYPTVEALVDDPAFIDLFDPADRAAILERLADGQEVRAADMRARRRDGTPIRLRMAVRREPDGELQGIVEDVTDARRLEEHLQRTQRLEAIGTLAWASPTTSTTCSRASSGTRRCSSSASPPTRRSGPWRAASRRPRCGRPS